MLTRRRHLIRSCRQHRRRAARVSVSAFTLLELILSLSLIILIMATVFGFYRNALRTREAGSQVARDAKLARAILEGIANEIRQVCEIVPGDGEGFKGTEDSITIVRYRMPEHYAFEDHNATNAKPPPAQLDMIRIKYQLQWDEEIVDENNDPFCHGLHRSEQKQFDPNPQFTVQVDEEDASAIEDRNPAGPQIHGEVIAPEIKYIEFAYFDGAKWRDRWQVPYELPGEGEDGEDAEGAEDESTPPNAPNTNIRNPEQGNYALPQAVRITIGSVPEPPEEEELDFDVLEDTEERRGKDAHHPDRFSIVVFIQQADPTLLSSRQHGISNSPEMQMGGGL